jgi:hypothetical protein
MINTPQANRPYGSFWALRREATLNWLALGMLLAAWNVSDNEPGANSSRRPEALRGYSQISVRAVNRAGAAELPH